MEDVEEYDFHVWVNPPQRKLPLSNSPIRVAVGSPTGPSSNSWRIWIHGDDVYVKCRDNFNEVKGSLHGSGKWRFGFTQEFVEARPGTLPDGADRAWTKWEPDLDDPTRPAVGFEIVVLRGGLYLNAEQRNDWPKSVVFIEPPVDEGMMTVLSVTLVQGQNPLRIAEGTLGVVVANVAFGKDRSVQLVATHQPVRDMEDVIGDSFKRAVTKMGGKEALPDEGVIFVHGFRSDHGPWVSAVRFT